MSTPKRIQLSRTAGFRLQEVSIALNGLLCVNVARPSPWGNPYRVTAELSAAESVAKFRAACDSGDILEFVCERWSNCDDWTMEDWLRRLRGKNLACWCKTTEPCHADLLLELANAQ